LTARVAFHVLEQSLADFRRTQPQFNTLVLHGVLHHLTNAEIRRVVADFCLRLAAPNAEVVVLEPIATDDLAESDTARRVRWLIDRLIHLPLSGQSLGIRKSSDAEIEVRERLMRRCLGQTPRGPSPKEHPFVRGELETLLSPWLEIVGSQPVLAFSFHVAKNMLLMRLSYPRLASFLMLPYLWLVSLFERAIMSRYPRYGSGGYSVFELKRFKIRTGPRYAEDLSIAR
jgi:hypothetical protein